MKSAPLILSGTLVNHDEMLHGSVHINAETGLIENICGYNPNATIAGDFLIFPGFVDAHTHLREDTTGTQKYKEDFETGSAAAINGGVVAVGDMANKPLPPTTREIYGDIVALTKRASIDILLYAAIAHGSRPFTFEGQKVPYKGFLAESINDLRFTSSSQAKTTLCHYRGEDVSLHCDDNEVLARCANEALHEDRRPAESEIEGIRLAIEMSREFGFALKVVHVSTRKGLELIEEARRGGLKILAEGTPHHCGFDRKSLNENNRKWLQMNPPLRTETDRFAIIRGLATNQIQFLASDHAPHTEEEKQGEKGMSGVPHLDTFGAFTTWLMAEHGFCPQDIARIASYNPGRWLSKFLPKSPRNRYGYGKIAPGYIGSLTVIDPNTPTLVKKEDLKTKCGWSPFTGKSFPGSVAYTIIRGKIMRGPR